MAAQLPASSRHRDNRGPASRRAERRQVPRPCRPPPTRGARTAVAGVLVRMPGRTGRGVVGPGQQLVNVDVAALGALGDDWVAVDVEEGFGGAVDRAHGVVGAAGAGRPRVQGLLVANLHQRLGDVVDVLDIHPAGHVGHASAGAGGGEQQDRGVWRRGVASSWRPRPDGRRCRQRRPASARFAWRRCRWGSGRVASAGAGDAGQAEGVVDPDGPRLAGGRGWPAAHRV